MKNLRGILIFIGGIMTYLLFLVLFGFMVGFNYNLWRYSVSFGSTKLSIYDFNVINFIIDIVLISIFGISHSTLARQSAKRKLKQYIPNKLIRTLYVLIAVITLFLLVLLWRPIGGVIYDLRSTIWGFLLMGVSLFGLGLLFISTWLISHFRLFGVAQTYSEFSGTNLEPLDFQTPSLYNYVRHPLYTGFLLFFWFTPLMTITQVVFATGMTVCILIGTYFEEKDLVASFQEQYQNYKLNVPYRYVPGLI